MAQLRECLACEQCQQEFGYRDQNCPHCQGSGLVVDGSPYGGRLVGQYDQIILNCVSVFCWCLLIAALGGFLYVLIFTKGHE